MLTYEVKIFQRMNLSFELVHHSAISMTKGIYGTMYSIVDYRVVIFPFNDVNTCDVTDTFCPVVLRG